MKNIKVFLELCTQQTIQFTKKNIRYCASILSWGSSGIVYILSPLPLVAACVAVFYSDWTEQSIRYSGCLLQLAGLYTVVHGISNTRKLFGKPTIFQEFIAWVKCFPRLRGRVFYADMHESCDITDSARAVGWHDILPGDSQDAILDKVIRNINILSKRVTATQEEMDTRFREHKLELKSEVNTRNAEISALGNTLDLSETGGLTISLIGLIWMFFGIVLTSSSIEISQWWSAPKVCLIADFVMHIPGMNFQWKSAKIYPTELRSMEVFITATATIVASIASAFLGARLGGKNVEKGVLLGAEVGRRSETLKEHLEVANLRKALLVEIETIEESYMNGPGKQIESTPENQPFTFIYPAYQRYFVIYEESSHLIGRIPDDTERMLIVKAYTQAKGLLDSYTFNNSLAERYIKLLTKDGKVNVDDHEMALTIEMMTKYTPTLKRLHKETMELVQLLKKSLRLVLPSPTM